MAKTLLAFLFLFVALGLSYPAHATDDKKITICHNTGSQTNPTVTITISENAWDAHKEHGDTKGACPEKTDTPKATPTQGPIPPTRPPFTVAPSATPTPTATPNVKTPAPTAQPTEKPKVKTLPNTSTETNSVPYDPGFDD